MALAPTRATLNSGNLPVELTSFAGRRQGLAELKRALASTRLLTLAGTGGVAKTKLALRGGLVADGAPNTQVAVRLFSEGIVESHLASIFNKHGVDSRLEVARWMASIQVTDPV